MLDKLYFAIIIILQNVIGELIEINSKEIVSKYRAPVMGLISLWIVLYHTSMKLPSVLNEIETQGFAGTDVFLFLSGFGLYYALTKNSDIMEFYKRRVKRIIPAYIPFLAGSYGCIIINHLSELKSNFLGIFQTFCGNISLLGRIAGLEHQTNCYIPLFLWLYFFTPMLYHVICDKTGRKRLINISALIVFVILINITFWGNERDMKCFSRIFVFIFGIIFASANSRISKRITSTLIWFAVFAAGIALIIVNRKFFPDRLLSCGFEYYPYILIAPSLSVLLAKVFDVLDRVSVGKAVNKFFGFLGKYSLGIYFVHSLFFLVVQELIKNRLNNFIWLGLSVAAVIMGIVYQYIIDLIVKKFSKKTA